MDKGQKVMLNTAGREALIRRGCDRVPLVGTQGEVLAYRPKDGQVLVHFCGRAWPFSVDAKEHIEVI